MSGLAARARAELSLLAEHPFDRLEAVSTSLLRSRSLGSRDPGDSRLARPARISQPPPRALPCARIAGLDRINGRLGRITIGSAWLTARISSSPIR